MNLIERYHQKLARILTAEEVKLLRKRAIVPDRGKLLVEEVHERQPKHILEIGRYMGYSLGMMLSVSPQSRITSIDVALQPTPVLAKIVNAFSIETTTTLIHGDSDTTPEARYDFVLIDGDHTYSAAKKDWDNVKHKLQTNAAVMFDDVYKLGNLLDEVVAELGVTLQDTVTCNRADGTVGGVLLRLG
jgi:predicted O-methyltransferase YrrM